MGAGVPRPVRPKSQMQRRATAKPRTEGMAASQRQPAGAVLLIWKPSQGGSSQNQSAKKAAPMRREAMVVSQTGAGCCWERMGVVGMGTSGRQEYEENIENRKREVTRRRTGSGRRG